MYIPMCIDMEFTSFLSSHIFLCNISQHDVADSCPSPNVIRRMGREGQRFSAKHEENEIFGRPGRSLEDNIVTYRPIAK